jgi:hypothetical protein
MEGTKPRKVEKIFKFSLTIEMTYYKYLNTIFFVYNIFTSLSN